MYLWNYMVMGMQVYETCVMICEWFQYDMSSSVYFFLSFRVKVVNPFISVIAKYGLTFIEMSFSSKGFKPHLKEKCCSKANQQVSGVPKYWSPGAQQVLVGNVL